MPLHSFPQIRTLSLTLIILFAALIVDLNLKRISVEYDLGAPRRLLTQAYRSLAAGLLNQTGQPKSSPDAPAASKRKNDGKFSAYSLPSQ